MAEAIAQRELMCVKPTGERTAVTLRIGVPYPASEVDWACPVELEGLHTRLSDIHGVDSFQALMLAQGLLRRLMLHVVAEGGSFRNVQDDSLVDIARLFDSGA